jgi:hypothetical protein
MRNQNSYLALLERGEIMTMDEVNRRDASLTQSRIVLIDIFNSYDDNYSDDFMEALNNEIVRLYDEACDSSYMLERIAKNG